MMRAVLTLLCSLSLVGCVHINQGSRPMGSIMSQSETPQPGDWCRVTYPETRSGLLARQQTIVTGKVEGIEKDGLHLSHVQSRQMASVPIADRVPMIRRLFKNTGVGTEHDGVVRLDGAEQVEIITETEADGAPILVVEPRANIAQQLVAAVPGRR